MKLVEASDLKHLID